MHVVDYSLWAVALHDQQCDTDGMHVGAAFLPQVPPGAHTNCQDLNYASWHA